MRPRSNLCLLALLLCLCTFGNAADAKPVDPAVQLKDINTRLAELEAKLKGKTEELNKIVQKIADVSYDLVRAKSIVERQTGQIEDAQRAQAEEKRKSATLAEEVKADQVRQAKFDETIQRLRKQNQSLSNSLELARAELNEVKKAEPGADKAKGDK